MTKIKAPRSFRLSKEGVFFLFTETLSFRPLQQGKAHYQLPRITSAADNEFRETPPEINL